MGAGSFFEPDDVGRMIAGPAPIVRPFPDV
jgi:hypothetical protein